MTQQSPSSILEDVRKMEDAFGLVFGQTWTERKQRVVDNVIQLAESNLNDAVRRLESLAGWSASKQQQAELGVKNTKEYLLDLLLMAATAEPSYDPTGRYATRYNQLAI